MRREGVAPLAFAGAKAGFTDVTPALPADAAGPGDCCDAGRVADEAEAADDGFVERAEEELADAGEAAPEGDGAAGGVFDSDAEAGGSGADGGLRSTATAGRS